MMFRRLYKRGLLEIYRARSSAWTEQQPSMAQRGKLMVAGSNPSGPDCAGKPFVDKLKNTVGHEHRNDNAPKLIASEFRSK